MKNGMNGDRYRITRNVYNKLRKKDHAEVEEFCTDVYRQGYDAGAASVRGISIQDVENAVKSVKGIGNIRRQKILDAVRECCSKEPGAERDGRKNG